MNYHLLSDIYYNDHDSFERVYNDRFAQGIKLDCSIDGSDAFFVENADIYKRLLAIERINGEISSLARRIPGIALSQYEERCLIDEIILTCDIADVYCSRREISTALSELKEGECRSRFCGIAEKYSVISKGREIPLKSSQDIRDLYDSLFSQEIYDRDDGYVLDGGIFRKEPVTVLDPAQRVIHEGVMPESEIIAYMDQALKILSDESIEPVIRTALFHYLFGYIHPFYEGNGRVSRFISSYMLGRTLHPLTGFRLSYVILEELSKYYKSFRSCNNILNMGDLTPFVLMFTDIVYKACAQLRDDLQQKNDQLRELMGRITELSESDMTARLYYVLIQAAIFSESGIPTGTLLEMFGVSRPTLQKRLGEISDRGLLRTEHIGKNKYYRIDIGRM